MTTRSWERKQKTGSASPGFAEPTIYDAYSQDGTNATRAERAAGIYKVHAYSMTRNRYSKPSVVVGFGKDLYNGSTDTCGAQPLYPNLPVPSSDAAVAKLLQKWRNSDINIGVTIGEGKEAADMIIDRSISIARAARELRRKNFGGALANLAGVSRADRAGALKRMNSGHAAQAWLELQYGWKPLLNDIYGAADLLKTESKAGVFRASEKSTGTILGASGFPNADVTTIKCERRVHLMVKVTNNASAPERLGLTDPLSIIWELTPWSFVADWFLPIGDSILATHAKLAMKTSEACTTQITEMVCQLHVHSGQVYGFWTAKSDGMAEFNYVTITRTVSFGVPNSWGIVDQIPGVLTPASDPHLTRVLNAAALARTNIRSLRR